VSPGRRAAVAAGVLAVLALWLFATFNQGHRIALRLGPWRWSGEAVFAIYAGMCLGMVAMFLLGLPADLAMRRERERLLRRLRSLEDAIDVADDTPTE